MNGTNQWHSIETDSSHTFSPLGWTWVKSQKSRADSKVTATTSKPIIEFAPRRLRIVETAKGVHQHYRPRYSSLSLQILQDLGTNQGSLKVLLSTYHFQWWHLQPKKQITLLRVIPTMTFIHFVTGKSSGILSGILSGISSSILPGICSGISSGILSGILSGISSGILSGISHGILSGILSGISSGILSGKSSGILSGKHSGTLSGISSGILSDILSGILSGISSGILSGISSGILSDMRSGREHLAWILAVEVRQGTLGVDGRGWGPAGNTGRGWSWLRSGREHWAWMVVVEVRQRTLCVEGRGWAGGGGEERRRGAANWHKI